MSTRLRLRYSLKTAAKWQFRRRRQPQAVLMLDHVPKGEAEDVVIVIEESWQGWFVVPDNTDWLTIDLRTRTIFDRSEYSHPGHSRFAPLRREAPDS